MVQGNGCPIVRNAWPTLKALRDEYSGKGVEFLMLNSNLQDDRDTIRAEAEAFGIDVPILVDETQLIGESLDLIRTAEVLIIDPDGWQIAYRGPLDDRLTYERQKAEAKEHYVRDALDATLAGRPVEVPRRDALGCLINFPEKGSDRHRSISYSETVAPILAEHCLGCHRPGGIAPWAMTEHRLMLGFAPMIREVLRTDRMPPWHSDPHVGQWLGDRSLSVDEIKTLVHWIEAGAPRGTGPDPLEELASPAPDWPLGEPDLIVTVPAFDVPATGVVDYQFPAVPNPLDRQRLGEGRRDRAARSHRRAPRAGGPFSADGRRARRRAERLRELPPRLRAGRGSLRVSGRHRRADRAGRRVRLSDALHADRQGRDGRHAPRALLSRSAARGNPAPPRGSEPCDPNSAACGAARGERVFRVRRGRDSV